MRLPLSLLPLLLVAACATPAPHSGLLSNYGGLVVREGAVRTSLAERKDQEGLAAVTSVVLRPTEFAKNSQTDWLNPAERILLLREIDAQLCFELSERYAIQPEADRADAEVRAVVSRAAPTGRVGSAASAAAGVFIPGPIGLRMPGGLGGLGMEAEMIGPQGRQLAALVWNRDAKLIGMDNPSLSRLGDALQLAEPFADAAGAAMSPTGVKSRGVDKLDPCADFGPRIRLEGIAARLATGLYVPQMSGASPTAPGAQ